MQQEAVKRLHGFLPVAGDSPRLLILGTFPGLASRRAQQYYGYGRNRFWPIMFAVFEQDFDQPSYEEKLCLLRDNHIALWDIIESCETEKSLDSDIRNPAFVDLHAFLKRYPGIARICFNGGNAARFAARQAPFPAQCLTLPSTSPAHARMSLEEKLELWRAALL